MARNVFDPDMDMFEGAFEVALDVMHDYLDDRGHPEEEIENIIEDLRVRLEESLRQFIQDLPEAEDSDDEGDSDD